MSPDADRARRRCTSRATRRSSTSSRILRDETTEPKKFREVVRELSLAARLRGPRRCATSAPSTVKTPLEETDGHELGERIGLIPILRAGLGMVDAMLELMPTAQVWHLGLFRDERTLRPVEYYNKLPDSATRRPVPDPRPDARHRRLGDGRDRGAQALGRRSRPDQARST